MRLLILAALLLAPSSLLAHGPRTPTPGSLSQFWTPEAPAVLVLIALGWMYAKGVRAVWRHAGRAAAISRTDVMLFASGWVALAVATVSPLHPIGGALFSVHMVQHELLVTIAAPLLVLGRPLSAFAWATSASTRGLMRRTFSVRLVRDASRLVRGIPGASILHAVVLWLWHIPALYEWSIHHSVAHALQHGMFLGSALLFWTATMPRRNGAVRSSSSDLAAGLALFATVLHTGLLGALITLSSGLLYPHYGLTTAPWGLMPKEDQQLAGLIMWMPGSIVYILAALVRGWHLLSLGPLPRGRPTAA